MFCCFLRNVSWNLILLFLSSLLALSPALKLEVLADMSALARYCSAWRTNSLIFKTFLYDSHVITFRLSGGSLIPEF